MREILGWGRQFWAWSCRSDGFWLCDRPWRVGVADAISRVTFASFGQGWSSDYGWPLFPGAASFCLTRINRQLSLWSIFAEMSQSLNFAWTSPSCFPYSLVYLLPSCLGRESNASGNCLQPVARAFRRSAPLLLLTVQCTLCTTCCVHHKRGNCRASTEDFLTVERWYWREWPSRCNCIRNAHLAQQRNSSGFRDKCKCNSHLASALLSLVADVYSSPPFVPPCAPPSATSFVS